MKCRLRHITYFKILLLEELSMNPLRKPTFFHLGFVLHVGWKMFRLPHNFSQVLTLSKSLSTKLKILENQHLLAGSDWKMALKAIL